MTFSPHDENRSFSPPSNRHFVVAHNQRTAWDTFCTTSETDRNLYWKCAVFSGRLSINLLMCVYASHTYVSRKSSTLQGNMYVFVFGVKRLFFVRFFSTHTRTIITLRAAASVNRDTNIIRKMARVQTAFVETRSALGIIIIFFFSFVFPPLCPRDDVKSCTTVHCHCACSARL